MNEDKIIRAITKDLFIKAMVIDSKDMVKTATEIHSTSPVISILFGRTITAASMLGAMLKSDNETTTLKIDGKIKLIAIADSKGFVRGYPSDPDYFPEINNNEKFKTGDAVGKDGFITVTKDLGLKEPYIGKCPLVSGEIAEDLTYYLLHSEQVQSACALGVLLDDKDDRFPVIAAGGFIVSVLPDCPENILNLIEQNIAVLPSVTTMLKSKMTVYDILAAVFYGMEYDILNEIKPEYKCNCSREKTLNALISLGKEELSKIAEDEKTEVSCHYCNKSYIFTKDELKKILS